MSHTQYPPNIENKAYFTLSEQLTVQNPTFDVAKPTEDMHGT